MVADQGRFVVVVFVLFLLLLQAVGFVEEDVALAAEELGLAAGRIKVGVQF